LEVFDEQFVSFDNLIHYAGCPKSIAFRDLEVSWCANKYLSLKKIEGWHLKKSR
jgi:hypothetical protein